MVILNEGVGARHLRGGEATPRGLVFRILADARNMKKQLCRELHTPSSQALRHNAAQRFALHAPLPSLM
jgi:hypothetical protein